jgi:hypothetical protein
MSCLYCHQAKPAGRLFHEPCFKELCALPITRQWTEMALEDFYRDLEKERLAVLQAKAVVDNVDALKDPLQVPIWLRAWETIKPHLDLKDVPELPGKPVPAVVEAKGLAVPVVKKDWGLVSESKTELVLSDGEHTMTLLRIKPVPGAFKLKGREHLHCLGTETELICIGSYTAEEYPKDWDVGLQPVKPEEVKWLADQNIQYKFKLQ